MLNLKMRLTLISSSFETTRNSTCGLNVTVCGIKASEDIAIASHSSIDAYGPTNSVSKSKSYIQKYCCSSR